MGHPPHHPPHKKTERKNKNTRITMQQLNIKIIIYTLYSHFNYSVYL